MNRYRNILLITLGLFAAAFGAARASCSSSMPYTFTNGVSTVSATTTNANNTFLLNCVNNVDNTQIGSAGIYASQIIPTSSGQATFGGTQSYTFTNGLTVQGALSIQGAVTFLGTINAAATPSPAPSGYYGPPVVAQAAAAPTAQPGNINVGGSITFGGSNMSVQSSVTQFIPASSSKPFVFANAANTVNNLTLFDAGGVEARENGQSTTTYLPMVYTASGGSVASTLHGVYATASMTTSGTCSVSTQCGGSINVNLSNAAVFSSATSYTCSAATSSVAYLTLVVYPLSGSALDITAYNTTGNSISSGTNVTVQYSCIGT